MYRALNLPEELCVNFVWYIFVIFIIFRYLVEALETVHNHRIIHRYSLSLLHSFIFHLVALNLQTSSWWNVMMMNWISGWAISPYHVYSPQERNSLILWQGLLFYLLLCYSLPPASTLLFMVCITCHLNNLIPLLLFHSGARATTPARTIFVSCRSLRSWDGLHDVTHWRVCSILLWQYLLISIFFFSRYPFHMSLTSDLTNLLSKFALFSLLIFYSLISAANASKKQFKLHSVLTPPLQRVISSHDFSHSTLPLDWLQAKHCSIHSSWKVKKKVKEKKRKRKNRRRWHFWRGS